MKDTSYAFAVGYIRSLETHLLNKTTYANFKESLSLEELSNKLQSIGYPVEHFDSLETLSLQLQRHFVDNCEYIRKACPSEAPFKWLWLKNDAANYKAVLKSVFSNSSWLDLISYPNSIDPNLMEKCIKSKNFDNMPDFFRQTSFDAFEIMSKTLNTKKTETYIDQSLYKIMLNLAHKDEFLLNRTKLEITLKNLNIALRYLMFNQDLKYLSETLIEGGLIDLDKIVKATEDGLKNVATLFERINVKNMQNIISKDPLFIEQISSDIINNFDETYKSSAFGFAPIVAYIKALKDEHTVLKSIAVSLLWNNTNNNI